MTERLTRREFVGFAAAAAATSLAAGTAGAQDADLVRRLTARASDAMADDLLEITIPRLQALYEDRRYTATQVTRWYLDRIASYDHVYRAILHVDPKGALATAAALDASAASKRRVARGPLWGVPIVIKANTSVKGWVTSTGWYGYLVPGLELVAPDDAPIVKKLRAAGAVLLGHTNMPDFAASDTNFSTAFGRTGNAYNARFSPGGSSGGTVTAVTANYCVLGNGTDTGNSIRMPASTSSVVGFLPTRGLVSIAGIHPLDWLRDNTGPIARDVTDVAIALDVMAGEDPKDFRTSGSSAQAQGGPYTKYLTPDALHGKRFGVPAFIVDPGTGGSALEPDTRALFLKALDGLRAAGATVVVDDAILPATFPSLISSISTQPYVAEGIEDFLRDYGPAAYHSSMEYATAVGAPIPLVRERGAGGVRRVETDSQADATLWEPQRRALAAYDETLDRFHLDGYVYPAAQMPPNDEIALLLEGNRSQGPHSRTGWVNPIGVPAVSIPGGFYANGLPFGIEISTRRWHDGDLLGWAFAYEQATKYRRPPVLATRR
jgi:Asp-tRNA(Asn)/Glu-tRNA(Gln) amidotransferase A subunit family amidase